MPVAVAFGLFLLDVRASLLGGVASGLFLAAGHPREGLAALTLFLTHDLVSKGLRRR